METFPLVQAIEAAFPLQPLPEMSLHQAHLSNDSMARKIAEEEWDAAGQLDSGRTWRDFTDNELVSCDAALAHFDEPSFIYYLPAFLLFAVRHCKVAWSDLAWDLVGSIVFSVTHQSPYSHSRYIRFSPAQQDAVISFLEFIELQGDSNADYARKALDRYWKAGDVSRLSVGP